MTRVLVLVVLGLVGVPGLARAQVDPFHPTLGGVTVSCESYTGQPVAFVANTALRDVGQAHPEEPGVSPTIEFNPTLLERLPPKVQLFWFGHVCAHEVLADNDSEENADRWALQWMMERGQLTALDRVRLGRSFGGFPPMPWSHRPEGMRLRVFAPSNEPPRLLREQYQGVKRWRFCRYIPGVSAPSSDGHVSRESCEENRLKLLDKNVGYVATDCLLTASEHCPAAEPF